MSYFKFELKRFLKNPKNQLCLGLLVLIFFGLFAFNEMSVNQMNEAVSREMVVANLREVTQEVSEYEALVKADPQDSERLEDLASAQLDKATLEAQLEALEAGDEVTYAELDNQANRKKLTKIKDRNSEEYQALAAKVRYYEAVKISGGKPSAMINGGWDTALVIGRSMMAWLSSTVIFVLLAVILADSVSSEIETTQIRFYPLVGGRKFSQLLTKLCVTVGVTYLVTLLSFVVLYFLKGYRDGWGTWTYPYMLTNQQFEPVWQVALWTAVVYLVALLFVSSLGQLLSLIFRRSLLVIGLIVLALTAFLTFQSEAWFQPLKKFLPFAYLSYGQIRYDMTYLFPQALGIGIAYLLGLSAIFMVFSWVLYRGYCDRRVV